MMTTPQRARSAQPRRGARSAERGDAAQVLSGAGVAFDSREARLLNDFQRGFPLVREPYAAIARALSTDEGWVRSTLEDWQRDGLVSRVGAVFRPGAIGVSTLAAMVVPGGDLARVAALVSAHPEVNHNYEREHRFNLWFVAAAADAPALAGVLAAIERETGYAPIALPLVSDYWIDLGFDLSGGAAKCIPHAPRRAKRAPPETLSNADRALVAALDGGLPLVPAPYAAIADAAGVAEAYVRVRLGDWLNRGVVKRFGVVVRHRRLGYLANAMCVWDVPNAPDAGRADALGEALAREAGVTLCYRRERSLPEWTYNLFCMLHGRDRATVEARLSELVATHGLAQYASAVLFSRRAFKQCGARYALAPRPAGTEASHTSDFRGEERAPVEDAVTFGA